MNPMLFIAAVIAYFSVAESRANSRRWRTLELLMLQ
jgi:hypothetical protein